MRETMRDKLIAAMRRQNPALAALVTAPPVANAREVLEEAFRGAPWARGALEALETRAPGSSERYAAALALETGETHEALFDQLRDEAVKACPF
jgi:hypothetical protein